MPKRRTPQERKRQREIAEFWLSFRVSANWDWGDYFGPSFAKPPVDVEALIAEVDRKDAELRAQGVRVDARRGL